MTSPFAQPAVMAEGDKFEPKLFFNPQTGEGRLLLIVPKVHHPQITTKMDKPGQAPTCATDADIIVVDQAGADGRPLSFLNSRLFGNLAKSTKDSVGSFVLGRLGQGENKQGTPPWILNDHTPNDAALATPVLTAYQQGQFVQPAQPSMSSPTPIGWQRAEAPQPWMGVAPQPAPGGPPVQTMTNTAPTVWQPPAQVAPAAWAPPPPAAPALDPNLVAYLVGHGIKPEFIATLDDNAARNLAATFGGS